MDKQKKPAVYKTILGRNPENYFPYQKPIVISLCLPRMGEWDFKWCVSEYLRCEYAHYGHKLMPRSNPVNVQVYGNRKAIEGLAKSGMPAVCELELVVKKLNDGREYILVNLFLTSPNRRVTHEFTIVPAGKERPYFVYTTKDMGGSGISVRPL